MMSPLAFMSPANHARCAPFLGSGKAGTMADITNLTVLCLLAHGGIIEADGAHDPYAEEDQAQVLQELQTRLHGAGLASGFLVS
jgi:hypothetical protein